MTYSKTKNKTACHPRAGRDPVLSKDYRLHLPAGKAGTADNILKAARNSGLGTRICLWSLVFSLLSAAAFAANYDIKEMTPEVREALAGRQTRYSELQQAKKSGGARENSQGYVDCFRNESLCSAENHDRQTIYRTIANQNGLGSAGLSQIQRAFAETIRERDSR